MFSFFKFFKRNTTLPGLNKINKVVGRFSKMAAELQAGIEALTGKKSQNEALIDNLQAQNAVIDSEVATAKNVLQQVNKLVGHDQQLEELQNKLPQQ